MVQLVVDYNLQVFKKSVNNISEDVRKQVLSNPPSLILMQGTVGDNNVIIGAFSTEKLQETSDEECTYGSYFSIPWSENSFIFYTEVFCILRIVCIKLE